MKVFLSGKYSLIPLYIFLAAISGFPGVGYFRYIYLIAGIIILFIFGKETIGLLKENKMLLLFYPFTVWVLLTALWSYNPQLSLLRGLYLGFIVTTGILSGFLWYKKFSNLQFLLPLNIIVIILSLVSLLIGYPSDNWLKIDVLAFRGFMTHPNTLSMLILFSSLPLFDFLFRSLGMPQGSSVKRNKYVPALIIIVILINLLILAVTFSRSAILAVIVFGILMMLTYHLKYLVLTFLVLSFLALISLFLFPQVPDYIYRQYFLKGTDSAVASRNTLIEDSFKAAKNGGLTGLGYGVSDTSIINPVYTRPGSGVREKGNSFLALTEETGLIGLILFVFPVFFIVLYGVKKNIKFSRDIMAVLFMIISLFVHSQFEGWLSGVASFGILYFFVFFGCLLSGFSGKPDKNLI